MGPASRPSTALSIARPTAGGRGTRAILSPLPKDSQHAVSVNFFEGLDVGAGCLEDAQPEEAQHRYQGEVVEVGGLPARGEHGFELEVAEAQRRGLGGDAGATYVFRRRVLEQTVDDTRAVEPGHDRESARDGGWLVAANLLHPAHEQLDVRALSCHGV